jgi:hypothetical protein
MDGFVAHIFTYARWVASQSSASFVIENWNKAVANGKE